MIIFFNDKQIKIFILIGLLVLFLYIIFANVQAFSSGGKGTHSKVSYNFVKELMFPEAPQQVRFSKNPENTSFKSKGEEVTCKALESIFNVPFNTVRPDFLKSPITGQNLELDCYNQDINVAAEYNGRQHYEYTPKWHKNYQDFRNGQYRDFIKQQLCKENGIKLITVPYTVGFNNIKAHLQRNM